MNGKEKAMTLNDVILPKKELIEERPKPRIAFWCFLVGFMALVYVRNILDIEYPIVLLVIYFGVIALFCDRDELVALAISCIPFAAAFQYKYAIMVVIAVYAIKFYSDLKKINLFAFVPLIVMMGWELLHGIYGAFSFTEYFRGFAELILCAFLIAMPKRRYDTSFISRVLAITVAFSCTVLLLILLEEVNYDFLKIFEKGNYRFGKSEDWPESYIMNYNANGLGCMCNIAVAGLLLRIKQTKINLVDIILIVALVFFGTLTLSRAYVICLALVFVLYAFSSGVKLEKIAKNFVLVITAIVALYLLLELIAPYVIDNIIERFSEEDVTGGRGQLLIWYTDYLFADPSHLLFGTGIQDILRKVNDWAIMDAPYVPHNSIQEVLVIWGVPGLFMFGWYILYAVINCKEKEFSFINLLPLILLLFKTMSGQFITAGQELLMLLFAIICIGADCSRESEKRYK